MAPSRAPSLRRGRQSDGPFPDSSSATVPRHLRRPAGRISQGSFGPICLQVLTAMRFRSVLPYTARMAQLAEIRPSDSARTSPRGRADINAHPLPLPPTGRPSVLPQHGPEHADRPMMPSAGSMPGGFEAELADGHYCGAFGRARGDSRQPVALAASRGRRRRQCVAGPPRLQPMLSRLSCAMMWAPLGPVACRLWVIRRCWGAVCTRSNVHVCCSGSWGAGGSRIAWFGDLHPRMPVSCGGAANRARVASYRCISAVVCVL